MGRESGGGGRGLRRRPNRLREARPGNRSGRLPERPSQCPPADGPSRGRSRATTPPNPSSESTAWNDVARCQVKRANTLYSMGRYTEAVAGYDAAQTAYERHGRETDAARCQAERANTLDSMGRYAEAVAGYDAAQTVYERHGSKSDVAPCHGRRPTRWIRWAGTRGGSRATTPPKPSSRSTAGKTTWPTAMRTGPMYSKRWAGTRRRSRLRRRPNRLLREARPGNRCGRLPGEAGRAALVRMGRSAEAAQTYARPPNLSSGSTAWKLKWPAARWVGPMRSTRWAGLRQCRRTTWL